MNSRANECRAEPTTAMLRSVENAGTEKYLIISQGFAGKQRLVPYFNRSNNEALILAVQSAGVSRGRDGFRKDKSGEN